MSHSCNIPSRGFYTLHFRFTGYINISVVFITSLEQQLHCYIQLSKKMLSLTKILYFRTLIACLRLYTPCESVGMGAGDCSPGGVKLIGSLEDGVGQCHGRRHLLVS